MNSKSLFFTVIQSVDDLFGEMKNIFLRLDIVGSRLSKRKKKKKKGKKKKEANQTDKNQQKTSSQQPFDLSKGWKLDTKYYTSELDFWLVSWPVHHSHISNFESMHNLLNEIEALVLLLDFNPVHVHKN